MTAEDWEYRYEQLLDLHLVDVPANYYDDTLFFSDPEDLKQIFSKIEEENL